MRELPQDRPYRFRPPVSRPWLQPLLEVLNRRLFLKRLYNVPTIECRGIEALRDAVRAGNAVMLAPNHADHADVHVMYEVCTKVGVLPRFMGAREIFERAGGIPSRCKAPEFSPWIAMEPTLRRSRPRSAFLRKASIRS